MYVIVTVNDEVYEPLAEWTVHKNKKTYCEKHGYTLYYSGNAAVNVSKIPFVAKLPPIPETHYPMGWAKIYAIKDAFEKYPECKWVFNTDCDVMITNFNIKLESIVNKYVTDESIHVLIPVDCNGINCGNMFIKNSPIGKAFLDTIIAGMPLYRNWYMFENQLIQDLCVGTHLTEQGVMNCGTLWGRVIRLVPQREFNSYDYKNLPSLKNRPNYNDLMGKSGQWEKGDFIVQWPSTDLEYRLKEAEKLYKSEKIISN